MFRIISLILVFVMMANMASANPLMQPWKGNGLKQQSGSQSREGSSDATFLIEEERGEDDHLFSDALTLSFLSFCQTLFGTNQSYVEEQRTAHIAYEPHHPVSAPIFLRNSVFLI
jgi:hypothetical protein